MALRTNVFRGKGFAANGTDGSGDDHFFSLLLGNNMRRFDLLQNWDLAEGASGG